MDINTLEPGYFSCTSGFWNDADDRSKLDMILNFSNLDVLNRSYSPTAVTRNPTKYTDTPYQLHSHQK